MVPTLATRDATLQPTNYQNITNSFFPKNVKQDFLVEIRLHVKHYESCDVLCTF
jgi:hypothetical protein